MSEVVQFTTGEGINYWDGDDQGYSHMVGWDNRKVRSEVYSFRTGSQPISHINFIGPPNSVYDGADIPIRFGISSSLSTYVTEYGEPQGSQEYDADDPNDMDINLSPNTTYYLVFFPGTRIDEGTWYGLLNFGYRPLSDNWITINATVAYTKCTAPTTLTLNKSIQVPEGTATLTWTGATAGANMTISSYDIYRGSSPDETFVAPYEKIGSTPNGSTTSFTVSAPATRGDSYYYKVVTVGSVSGYNSTKSVASSGLKANTLPNPPLVSVDTSTIPSDGGDVTFTVSTNGDDDGQNLSLYYATSSSGTKSTFTSPSTIHLSGAATYYFYVYDGLEYSTATSQSITVNARPAVTSVTYDSLGTYTALGGNGIEGYQLGYASNITPKISVNKTGTVTVGVEYYTSNGTEAFDTQGTGYGYINIQQIPVTTTTDIVLSNYNIHQYITLGTTNVHWRMYFRLNDGSENSGWVYYPSESSGQYYTIAHAPALLASYNQFANSDVAGTITGEVWRNVRLKVYNDTSVPLVTASAVVNGLTLTATATSSTDSDYRYIDVTLPDGIDGGASIAITASMKDASNSISKNVGVTVTETKIPVLNTLSHGAAAIKPFTSTGSFEIVTVWPFGLYEHIDATTLAAYNCSTTASNAIKLVHSSSNSGSGANRVEKILTWDRSGDNIATTMDREDAYDWDYSLGVTSYSGSYTYYCRLEIINLFGKVVATPWLSRTFNFAEPVQSPTITSIDWSLDGSTNWAALGNRAIQEGVYLRFNCSFGLFTTDEVELSVLLTNSSGERSISCYESGSPSKITPITYLSTELMRATGRTAATNTKSYIFHITTEIADTTDRKWRLQFVNSGYTTNSSYATTPVVRHSAPDLVLVDCDTDEDYELTYVYNMSDLGYDSTNENNTIVNYLSDGETRMASTPISNTVGQGVEGTLQATVTGWEVKTICVEMVTTVVGLYSHTKTFYSTPVLVFQISPTVAYRKNQLGINTAIPNNDAIVDIHQSTGKEKILIQGFTTDFIPAKFEIDITTGQIRFYLYDTTQDEDILQHTLDLLNGTLT